MRKIGHREFVGVIRAVSGIRIGGSDDLLQIGGTDLTCVKHPVTHAPYLPGSSIKGKMRSELEQALGQFGGRFGDEPCGCARCLVCRVFGPHKNTRHELGPSRIIVRDAAVLKGGDLDLKSENVINRKTGTALHPRKVERVAAGAEFGLKIGLQIWDFDHEVEYGGSHGADALVAFVSHGLRLLQLTGIGSGVSKGSGEIEIHELTISDPVAA